MSDKVPISRFEIEKIIFQCAKPHVNDKHPFAIHDIRGYIENKISRQFLEGNEKVIYEVIFSLIRAGIFNPGQPGAYNSTDTNLPWLTITEYGASVIENEAVLPTDPSGYIAYLKTRVPNVDEVVLYYLGESIRSFHQHLLVSATLTLGAASERLIILLSNVFVEAHSDIKKQEALRIRFGNLTVYNLHKKLLAEIKQIEKQLPEDLLHNFDVYINQFFQFVRLNRNEKGHPEKLEISRDVVYGNMQIMISYTERIYALINHLQHNPIT